MIMTHDASVSEPSRITWSVFLWPIAPLITDHSVKSECLISRRLTCLCLIRGLALVLTSCVSDRSPSAPGYRSTEDLRLKQQAASYGRLRECLSV